MYRLRSSQHAFLLHPGVWGVGRRPTAGIYLASVSASREHARIWVGTRAIEVEDLDSRNGTFVNGRRITGRRELCIGDSIRFGRVDFVLDAVPDLLESGLYTPVNPVRAPYRARPRGTETGVLSVGPDIVGPDIQEQPPEQAHVVIAVKDFGWVERIVLAASFYQNLAVTACSPKEVERRMAAARFGCLLLDLHATGRRRGREILRTWWARDQRRGPVIIAHTKPKHKGVVLARKLGAQAYIQIGKKPEAVVAQIAYQVQRASDIVD